MTVTPKSKASKHYEWQSRALASRESFFKTKASLGWFSRRIRSSRSWLSTTANKRCDIQSGVLAQDDLSRRRRTRLPSPYHLQIRRLPPHPRLTSDSDLTYQTYPFQRRSYVRKRICIGHSPEARSLPPKLSADFAGKSAGGEGHG